MKRNISIYKVYIILALMEGVATLALAFRLPSMDKNAWLFGYSIPRLLIGIFILVIVLTIAWFFYKSVKDSHYLWEVNAWLKDRFEGNSRLFSITVVLLAAVISGIGVMLIYYSSLSTHIGMLKPILERTIHILVWGIAVGIQSIVALALLFRDDYRGFRNHKTEISRTILIIMMIEAAIFHWFLLYFKIGLFGSIPGWFWQTRSRGFASSDILWVGVLIVSIALIRWVMRSSGYKVRNLIILILLGYLIQVSFGFLDSFQQGQLNGFEPIRLKYAESSHNVYAWHAANRPTFSKVLTQYEENYGDQMYVGTKPPGVLFFYMMTQKISSVFWPIGNYEARFMGITRLASFVYPLLSFLILIILYLLYEQLGDQNYAIVPGVLFVFIPNIILMPLFLDQVLYPLLFLMGAYLAYLTAKKQKLSLAIITGGFIYLANYFSFSLLALFPFVVLIIGFDYLINFHDRKLGKLIKLIIGLGIGLGILYLIFQLILGYDFLARYEEAMYVHRHHDFVVRVESGVEDAANKQFQPPLEQVLRAMLLNNVEIFSWLGFPVALLFLYRAIRTVARFYQWGISLGQRRLSAVDGMFGAFIVTFFALNLFGQTQGEVGRLWLFLVPMFVLFASAEIPILFRNRNRGLYLVIFLQMITILLIFKFQDFLI